MMGFTNKIIDKSIPIPLYFQLKQIILDEINSSEYNCGDMIPTELELTKIFGLSRITVRQAISELVKEGHLYRVKGKGTFITRPKIEQEFMSKIERFDDQMARKGYEPSTKVLEKRIMPASKDISKQLGVNEGELVLKLKRLRFANNDPIVFVDTYLSAQLCNHIYDFDLEKESLYDILSTKEETKVCMMRRTVEASIAGKYESEILSIPEGFPVQTFYSLGCNKDNTPIEYSIAKYRGDMSRFTVEISL